MKPMTIAAEEFRRCLTEYFRAKRSYLFARGRLGLYAGLRAMELPPGAKVIVPGYTCMVVASAIKYVGLVSEYVDIDPKTYNINPSLLSSVSSDSAALIVQHTYGIPCDMPSVQAWTTPRDIPIIEDCCHAVGSTIDGRLCGTFGRFAFLSGQWNKPFSTGLGGMLVVNDPALVEAVERLVNTELKQRGRFSDLLLRCQIAAHDLLVRPATALWLMRAYRLLNRLGLVVGSWSPVEMLCVMPDDYFTAMSPCQIQRGLREMARIDDNIRHRKMMTAFYHDRLSKMGFAPLDVPGAEAIPLLRYPVRVANKQDVLTHAASHRVEIGSWFECPLHPDGTPMEMLGYSQGMCPESERACREVINLPTHLKADESVGDKTLKFLAKFAKPA